MSDQPNHHTTLRQLRAETHAAHVGFLLTELRTALALLRTGEASRRADTPARTRALAREAYDVVEQHLAASATAHGSADAMALGPAERALIARLHAELGTRLREVG